MTETTITDFTHPTEVSDVLMVFPANVVGVLMPAHPNIPAEFNRTSNEWVKVVNDMWSGRLPADTEFHARPDIIAEHGHRHLSVILGSYEPKHEHKIAAAAYLASLWFTRVGPPDSK